MGRYVTVAMYGIFSFAWGVYFYYSCRHKVLLDREESSIVNPQELVPFFERRAQFYNFKWVFCFVSILVLGFAKVFDAIYGVPIPFDSPWVKILFGHDADGSLNFGLVGLGAFAVVIVASVQGYKIRTQIRLLWALRTHLGIRMDEYRPKAPGEKKPRPKETVDQGSA